MSLDFFFNNEPKIDWSFPLHYFQKMGYTDQNSPVSKIEGVYLNSLKYTSYI